MATGDCLTLVLWLCMKWSHTIGNNACTLQMEKESIYYMSKSDNVNKSDQKKKEHFSYKIPVNTTSKLEKPFLGLYLTPLLEKGIVFRGTNPFTFVCLDPYLSSHEPCPSLTCSSSVHPILHLKKQFIFNQADWLFFISNILSLQNWSKSCWGVVRMVFYHYCKFYPSKIYTYKWYGKPQSKCDTDREVFTPI